MEIDNIAYGLFCDVMTTDVRVSGYSKSEFVNKREWFCVFYYDANIILRNKKIKKIINGITII